ncbi:MAG: hypothetical protein ACPG31_02845 [Planctomycetota bacterium]
MRSLSYLTLPLLLTLGVSCQVAIGTEASNEHGGWEIKENASGNDVLNGENRSGKDVEGQWLDADKEPIDVDGDGEFEDDKFHVPDGGTITIEIPDGAEFIQLAEAPAGPSPGGQAVFFKFYRLLPGAGLDFHPTSGQDQLEASYTGIEATDLLTGWAKSRAAFQVIDLPLPGPAGTVVADHMVLRGDRSQQTGGPFSPFQMSLEVADENPIVEVRVLVDGVLIGTDQSPGVIIQTGSWGSIVTFHAWVEPRVSWLQGKEVEVQYRVPADPIPWHNITMNLGRI